jgi:DNA-binding MarR family transcriptional regulator
MDRTTCTRELAPLVSEGLIEITAGSDRRHRVARLTGPGARKRSRAHEEWEEVQQEVADEFGEASIDDLLTGLRRLLATSERLNAA